MDLVANSEKKRNIYDLCNGNSFWFKCTVPKLLLVVLVMLVLLVLLVSLVSLVLLVLLVLCERSAGMNGLLEWLEFPTLGGNSFRDVAQRVVVVVRLRLLLRSNSRRGLSAHQQELERPDPLLRL